MKVITARRHVLPGFHLSLGFTLFYFGLLVFVPFLALTFRSFSHGWLDFWNTLTEPQVVATYKISFGISLLAALFDGVAGLLIAWVITRYSFPGRRILDALIDLPFALPTAVAGIALTALYSPEGWIGKLDRKSVV